MSDFISKRKLYHELGEAYKKGHLSWGANEVIKDIIGECDSVEIKGDLISRKAVLDELEKWDWQDLYLPIHFKQILDDIPSADVRPNIHGHWIKINSGDEDFPESIVCDRCNHENSHLDFNEHNEPIGKVFVTSNFCPNCGADMRGE